MHNKTPNKHFWFIRGLFIILIYILFVILCQKITNYDRFCKNISVLPSLAKEVFSLTRLVWVRSAHSGLQLRLN